MSDQYGVRSAFLYAALILGGAGAQAELTDVPLDLSPGFSTHDGDLMQLQLAVEPRWDFVAGDRGSVVASLRLRVDGRDELEPGEPAFESYSELSRPITLGTVGTLEIRDLYYEHRLEHGILRLGKQQIVWGRLDGVKILDVVNPQTYREFILDDLSDSRISQWAAYLDLSLGNWRTELAWIPDLSGHDVPEPGAWFELTAPRFRFGAPVDAPGLPTVTDRGDDPLSDGALGLRVSGLLGGVDLSALVYTGLDHEPLGRVSANDGGQVLEQFYQRRNVLGLSAESSLGPVAWRAELSYQPERAFNVRDPSSLGTVELDQTTLGLGADIMLPHNLLANVQVLWDRVHEAPATLVRPDEDRMVTLFLRRGFAYETVRAEFRWYHSLTDRDDTLVASVRYDLDDDTSAYVSVESFSGTPEGVFGQLDEQERVYFGITRHF